MKNDQTEQRKHDPRHIYANPTYPIVCPIHSLSIYFSTFSITGPKDTTLFLGKNRYKRFAKYFEFLLKKYSNEIKDNFGVGVKDIGGDLLR